MPKICIVKVLVVLLTLCGCQDTPLIPVTNNSNSQTAFGRCVVNNVGSSSQISIYCPGASGTSAAMLTRSFNKACRNSFITGASPITVHESFLGQALGISELNTSRLLAHFCRFGAQKLIAVFDESEFEALAVYFDIANEKAERKSISGGRLSRPKLDEIDDDVDISRQSEAEAVLRNWSTQQISDFNAKKRIFTESLSQEGVPNMLFLAVLDAVKAKENEGFVRYLGDGDILFRRDSQSRSQAQANLSTFEVRHSNINYRVTQFRTDIASIDDKYFSAGRRVAVFRRSDNNSIYIFPSDFFDFWKDVTSLENEAY